MHRVLLVDDEEGFTSLMKIQLEATKRFKVRVVNESPDAVGAAREFQPDVILLDVVMPDLDGGEVSAQLKREELLKGVPVIFVTALSGPDDEDEAGDASENVKAGERIVLAKPLRTERLLAVLDKVLGA